MSNPIKVVLADTKELREKLFAIRREVFVVEQEVDPSEEFDEYEDIATHFVMLDGDDPIGAARWRKTDKGIKLERFAIKKSYRSKGHGSAIVQKVLDDIVSKCSKGECLYLHAQLPAVPLYEKFGFQKTGPQFEECNIQHFKMERLV